MYKTRLGQGIEEKGGDLSNVFKTIVEQGIEGGLGYCANGPMTIGSKNLKEGWLHVHRNGRQLRSARAS